MSVSITTETKNSVSLTLESKDTGLTWGQANFPWSSGGSFGVPGSPIEKETKNNVSLTLESR